MKNTLRFTKMQSLGNDFLVIDALTQEINLPALAIKKLSDRNLGVGFDQLLLIEPPTNPDKDFYFRIFNADGSQAEQCGNGTRCAASFVIDKNLTNKHTLFWQSLGGDFKTCYTSQREIQTQIALANCLPITHTLDIGALENAIEVHAISIGNPHAVVFVDNIQTAEVANVGSAISDSKAFPEGANVGFCQLVDQGFARLRVFERGVGETMACGTGACAAAIVSASKGLIGDKVKISMPGGKLKLAMPKIKDSISLSGPAFKVFEGKLEVEGLT